MFGLLKFFLIIAIFSPLYVRFNEHKSGYALAFITLAMLLFSLLISSFSYGLNNKFLLHFLSDIFFPAVVYGSVFMLGYKVLGLKAKDKLFIFLFYIVVFIACLIFYYHLLGRFSDPQYFKYPPSLFYIAYSLSSIFIVMWFFERIISFKEPLFIMKFISSNTIWIYLWHIPIVEYFHRYEVPFNFVVKYLIAILLSVVITLIQVRWVRKTKIALLNNLFTG
ncbi:TPA: acyltransferase family protein [Klebsiella pneumoniae]|nr:acyltransferase family protein [Klebsiella pneumoniae]HEN3754567.1 acyltransferase family protein [Klebsiella pneumoniae]